MKTKYYISIAAAMLLTLASLATQAQDVYEYATVIYDNDIRISYSTGEYKVIALTKEEIKQNTNIYFVPVMKLLAEMSKEGWESINMTSTVNGAGAIMNYRYFLKRKVKQ